MIFENLLIDSKINVLVKNDQQLRPGGHGGRKEAMNKLPRKQLVLKAVLLLRTVNRYSSKETQLKMMDKYYSTEQLEDYVEHFKIRNQFMKSLTMLWTIAGVNITHTTARAIRGMLQE